jgi:hypothetical protein
MNKYFNVLVMLVFFPTMFLAFAVGFDTPLSFLHTTGSNIPYKHEAFIALGIVMLLINLRRSIRRWVALNMVNSLDKFKWNTIVSKERIKRVYTYNFLEAFVWIVLAYALYRLTPLTLMPAIGLLFGSIDAIIFAILGASLKKFRVGITSKALLAGDRDVTVIYFMGLRKVEYQQKTVFFTFKDKDLQFRLPIDMIPEEKRSEFFTVLRENVDEKKVYFSNNIPF